MITFKQKALFSAIAGAGALALTGAANAVYVNHDGLGQVLVYPYYTARDGVATLLSVVNTTNNAKIVKVRFLEGKNSQEVLDFNLFLSPFDVWTGGVTAKSGGAYLTTSDTSCTNPAKSGNHMYRWTDTACRNANLAAGCFTSFANELKTWRTLEGQ